MFTSFACLHLCPYCLPHYCSIWIFLREPMIHSTWMTYLHIYSHESLFLFCIQNKKGELSKGNDGMHGWMEQTKALYKHVPHLMSYPYFSALHSLLQSCTLKVSQELFLLFSSLLRVHFHYNFDYCIDCIVYFVRVLVLVLKLPSPLIHSLELLLLWMWMCEIFHRNPT